MTERFWQSDDGRAELWLADSLDPVAVGEVMAGRVAQALIVDAPYSARTHRGHDSGSVTANRAASYAAATQQGATNKTYAGRVALGLRRERRIISYRPWDQGDVARFYLACGRVFSGWLVSLTDHVLFPSWESGSGSLGRLTFPPIPFVETGSRVRMSGDGPSNWSCFACVSRPPGEPWSKWGTLRGAYVMPCESGFQRSEEYGRIIGGKPVRGMCMVVADYSRHGDLVVDPCCGAGTTLVAARMLGRSAIGIDTCREHLEIAARRLAKVREQVTLGAEFTDMTQEGLPL